MNQSDYKMTLGNKPPFARMTSESFCAANYNGACITSAEMGKPWWWEDASRHFPAPLERFRDRIETRNRYRRGPKPWKPGRYTSSFWQPYTGIGRFSGVRDWAEGQYYAARYSGVHITPEHYLKSHGRPGEYERHMAARRREKAWNCSPPPPVSSQDGE